MIVINVSKLKATLSENLAKAKNGETIIVTDRRNPIAKIVAFRSEDEDLMERRAARPFAAIRIPPPRSRIDAQALLDEDRGER